MKSSFVMLPCVAFAVIFTVLGSIIAQRDGSVSGLPIVVWGVAVGLVVVAIGTPVRARRERWK
jgi:hypothetical protein